jgi:hypothetical protein
MSIVTGSFRWYDKGIENILSDPSNLTTDDIKIALLTSSYTPNVDHLYYDVDITNEVANANGYTTGGVSLTTKTLTYDTSGIGLFTSDNPLWTVTSGSIVSRYWIMYNNTPASNKPLLCYGHCNYNGGAPLDLTATITFGIILNVNGWFRFTKTDNP